MPGWLTELHDASREITQVRYELIDLQDCAYILGLDRLGSRLYAISDRLEGIQAMVDNGAHGAVDEIVQSAQQGTANMILAALAVCEIGCGEEEKDERNEQG